VIYAPLGGIRQLVLRPAVDVVTAVNRLHPCRIPVLIVYPVGSQILLCRYVKNVVLDCTLVGLLKLFALYVLLGRYPI
jgi:hypothetical protein